VRAVTDNPTVAAARSTRLEGSLIALLAAALAFQLLVPPIVGLADNGDFSRVTEPLGIFPPAELGDAAFFSWIVPQYRFDPGRVWIRGLCCYSSQTALALAALPVGVAAAPRGRFDLRATGLVNGLALVAAVGLLLSALRPLPFAQRTLAGLLLVAMFSDVTYVSMLNSFYTEPAALVFFLTALALALRLARSAEPPGALVAGFFLASALLATSRPQNALLGVFLAILGWRLVRYERSPRRRAAVGIAAILLGVASLVYSAVAPRPLQRIYLYNAVFRALLPASPDPRGDLVRLGLPPEFSRWNGVPGFSPEAPVNDENFQRVFGKMTYRKLAAFYAANPARIREAFESGAEQAFFMRPFGIGNFARETGRPAGSRSRSFSAWSRIKAGVLPGHTWFVLAYLGASLAAAVHLRWKGRNRAIRTVGEIGIALVLFAAFQFAVAAVMTAAESRRSFFLFNAVFDVTLIGLVLWAWTLLRNRGKSTSTDF
jgi:hypothetical protein